MTLLEMSFYGAVIILAILLIRAFTLHKLPKKTFLILWGVALLRLLVPFEISSEFSLYSRLPEELNVSKEADVHIPDPDNSYELFQNYADYLKEQGSTQIVDDNVIIVKPTGGAIYLPNENPDVEAIPLPDVDTDVQFADKTTNPGAVPTGNTSRGTLQTLITNVLPYLPALWLVGTLLCAAFFLISYIRCYLEFRTSLPVTEEYAVEWLKQHPLMRTISIRQSDKISAPLTYGIFRPVILMPKKTDWNNFTQLDYVLYHEFTHIRRFDLAAKLVMIVALCLHWFNPFVWVMYFFFNRDLELSCDDCVVKHFKESKADYAQTLIGMEEKKNFSTPLCNHFSKNAIEERITAIMKSKKTTTGMMIAAIVIIVIVVITLTTGRKDEDTSTNITPTATATPTVTESVTLTPTRPAEPTPALGMKIYSPETNYTYSDKDSLAQFDYNSSTISPKDGYDFIISSMVSTADKPLLSNVTINLEPYAGNTTWWCLAAFYDNANNVYLEFVPAAGVEDAPSGILHVTIPVANPTSYTVHPAGDFHAQKASAFWFSDILKIQDKIYFNNGSCNGSLWVYDITTGEMSDLTYVNEKMQEIANELCSDFGWEKEPAVWFNVGWYSENGTTVYEARVCKEMDTETFFIIHLYYEDELFLDYSSSYKGAQGQPSTQEELNTQMQELFSRYLNMQHELFDTNLKCADIVSADDWVTINGQGGYIKVTDERFPTLKSVFDYMETICTPDFAKKLRKEYLGMESDYPVLAEANGELYTQLFVNTSNEPASFRFTDITILDSNRVRVGYQGYQNSLINVRVSGTIDFVGDNGWRIDSITIGGGNPFFDAYNGEKLQVIECTETDSDSPNYCDDIIFYHADESETIEDVLVAMKTAILENLTLPSDSRPFTVTDYDVTVKQPYEQIDMFAWRLPILTGYYAFKGVDLVDFETMKKYATTDAEGRVPFLAQGSDEVFYFILLEKNGVYRLQREEAAKDMLNGTLTYYDSVYRETPPDYLSSYASFPTFPAGDAVVAKTGWDLTFLDELYLPSYSQLKDAGATFETNAADNHNIGMFHTAALNGILYFFVEEDADKRNTHAFHLAITSQNYPLSGGAITVYMPTAG